MLWVSQSYAFSHVKESNLLCHFKSKRLRIIVIYVTYFMLAFTRLTAKNSEDVTVYQEVIMVAARPYFF